MKYAVSIIVDTKGGKEGQPVSIEYNGQAVGFVADNTDVPRTILR